MYTREEFEELRLSEAKDMWEDKSLKNKAISTLCHADSYHWINQTNWQGEPVLQLPQDMFAIQEIILDTKPDHIIEVGVAWGGSLLFYSTLMAMYGGKSLIGIDIYMPEDMVDRVTKKNIGVELIFLEGSSLYKETLDHIKNTVDGKCMVILDSNHTHEHVLKELNIYSELVSEGCYLICADTVIEDMPKFHRAKEWGKGNNPRTALNEFLDSNENFERDERIRNKLLFSCHPDGYLRKVK